MLKLHDSLQKKLVPFKSLEDNKVRMYNCGPTVYSDVHIGNLRSFLLADLLRRVLERNGFEVTQVMNITDVGHMLADADVGEDKMEVAAKKEGKSPAEVAALYTERFFRDMDRMNMKRAQVYPKASEHVADMIAMIEALLERGHAYQVQENGGVSVYFDVSSFPKYGALSGNTVEGLEPGARIDVRQSKKHPADFALWIHNPHHLMQWNAPWGSGYPGWHIECSAMATKYLGSTIDIHTGGEDNKFPHHECEIAQSEGATEKQFVRYWLHATHLLVDGKKMSKSLGNFYTLEDLVSRGADPRAVRWLILSVHYRSSLNFTVQGIDGAKSALSRVDALMGNLMRATPSKKGRSSAIVKKALKDFDASLNDDLNVPNALAAMFTFVTEVNAAIADGTLTQADKDAGITFLGGVGRALGFTFGRESEEADVPESVKALAEKRVEARHEKRFAESDRLRDELKALGWIVEDAPDGQRLRRA